MYQPGIDIIVTNYKTAGDLERFVRSVLVNRPVTPHTLTIMNVSPERADIDVAEAWVEAVHVELTDNVGYARACNAGAAKTSSEYLAFFNADVALTAGAIDECYRAMQAHQAWGVLGPRQVDDAGLLTHAGIFGTHAEPRARAWHQPNSNEFADVVEAVTVSGSAYFVRRACWDELARCETYRRVAPGAEGAFLPTPHFFEETWFSYHAHAHGWKVVYYGPVCIVHLWHRASPVGGWAAQQFPISREIFRTACEAHGILHD